LTLPVFLFGAEYPGGLAAGAGTVFWASSATFEASVESHPDASTSAVARSSPVEKQRRIIFDLLGKKKDGTTAPPRVSIKIVFDPRDA
jgi:hypothetical protein